MSVRLACDPTLLLAAYHATLRPGPVTKHPANPLLWEDVPWEPRWDDLKPNVVREPDGRWRLWYSPFIRYAQYEELGLGRPGATWPPAVPLEESHRRATGICYAESDDGIAWRRPQLDLVPYAGSPRTNILRAGSMWSADWHGAGIGRDDREPDPARRYKMLLGIPGTRGPSTWGLATTVSADGLRWSDPRRVLGEDAWPAMSFGDAHNHWTWDPLIRRYVGITQTWSVVRRVRSKLRTESADFEDWSPLEPLRYDPPAEVHTHLTVHDRGMRLGLLHLVSEPDGLGDGGVALELGVSEDGVAWRRCCPGMELLPRGAPRAIDSACVFAAAPIMLDDVIRLYYGANDGPIRGWRRGHWCLATLPRDRWASWTPMDATREAVLVTRELAIDEGFALNASVRGSLEVEAHRWTDRREGLASEIVPAGDHRRWPLRRLTEACARAGVTAAHLRLRLRDADCFAIRT